MDFKPGGGVDGAGLGEEEGMEHGGVIGRGGEAVVDGGDGDAKGGAGVDDG